MARPWVSGRPGGASLGRILESIRETVRGRGVEVGTSVTRAHTGRVSDSLNAEQQACERLVNDWLDGGTGEAAHWGRELTKELISELPRCAAPTSYRARPFPERDRPTDPLQFGPPPSPGAGRYNRAGQPALYLGRDVRGLSAEMAHYPRPGQQYYFARYLSTDSLSLVDLSDANAHAALHLAFDRAERLDVDYEPAQLLADVIRELGIDGIIVPGVRGSPDHHYCNVVVFRCLGWEDWVDKSHSPTLLPELDR